MSFSPDEDGNNHDAHIVPEAPNGEQTPTSPLTDDIDNVAQDESPHPDNPPIDSHEDDFNKAVEHCEKSLPECIIAFRGFHGTQSDNFEKLHNPLMSAIISSIGTAGVDDLSVQSSILSLTASTILAREVNRSRGHFMESLDELRAT